MSAASNKLIQSLKEELNVQLALAKHGEQARQQLERSETNVCDLESKICGLEASLSSARSEIKSLSAKLSASRAAEACVKNPGSALEPGVIGHKSAPSEVVRAAQAREDLYGDLTGLIVRGMKRGDGGSVFDCIQTGRNGSKLPKRHSTLTKHNANLLKLYTSSFHWMPEMLPIVTMTSNLHIALSLIQTAMVI